MVRNLRTLCLVAVAAFALSAMIASAAQAEKFTAAQYPATLSGASATHSLTFEGAHKYECANTTFSGEIIEASESVKLTPTYAECTMTIAGTKTKGITISSCKKGLDHVTFFFFTRTKCAEGYVHIIRIFKKGSETEVMCEYEAAPIEGEKITHENLGETKGIKLTWEIGGISYKLIAGTVLLCGPAEGKATYSGSSTISAKNGEGKAIAFDIG